jgi:sporulation integral membrane protein YlbJ
MIFAGFMAYPQEILFAIREAFALWLTVLVPALIPFLILSEWLMANGWLHAFGKWLAPLTSKWFRISGESGCAVITGYVSGYPMTARMLMLFVKNGQIPASEACRVAGWATTADPMFIGGAVAIGLFSKPEWTILLLIAHFGSSILLGWASGRLWGSKNHHERSIDPSNVSAPLPSLQRLPRHHFSLRMFFQISVNSLKVLFLIGGMILICSALITSGMVFIEPILHSAGIQPWFVKGFVEVSLGVKAISGYNDWDPGMILVISSAILAWGGLSVHAQVISFLQPAGIRWLHFAGYKLLHAATAALICWSLINVIRLSNMDEMEGKPLHFPVFLWSQRPIFSENTDEYMVFVKFLSIFSFIFISLLVYWFMKSTDTTIRWDHDEKCDECKSGHRAAGAHRTTG